ncbi:helix-turn-helix domain-containing protein [Clostridium sp. JN-9]|uniref:excisionase n=1 Tax=Clostridium sp. JN-9 TaxID=2507159 RepID=UPI000FFE07DE|nr:helix-turn-helix domain-containing protein [Clostridium sp. JN-9]QAT40868.1 helix-turn-helix domain-containing protein [Clostridium sp. JN-9]
MTETALSHENLKETFKEVLLDLMPKQEKATLTIQECANFTGIGRDKLMELAHSKNSDFPCFKVGAKFLINKEMLMAWLDKITKEGRTL